MSDEERDESQDQAITGALRSNVANAFRTNRDEVTLRKMRTKVEQQLGLPEEFLKLDPYWNAHSKKIVLQEVVGAARCVLSTFAVPC